MTELTWRKSSFTNNGTCVEITETDSGIAMRNSNYPTDGTLVFKGPVIAAWIKGCKAGEFDDLT